MFIRNLRSGRRLAALAIFSVIAVSAFGFAEANTFTGGNAGRAGDGAGDISGYAVSGITYTLDASNPSNITGVTFTLNAAATTVRAGLNTAPTTLCTAAVSPANTWDCSVSGLTSSATSLRVAAAQ